MASPNVNKSTKTLTSNQSNSKQTWEILQLIGDIILLLIKSLWYIGEAIYKLFVPLPEKSIQGEIVLITGTGHGIGRELALSYASQGATVVCWDINKKGNEETVKEIAELGYPTAYSYVCNVANRDDVIRVSKSVLKEIGDVSILVNNAGIMPCHPFLEYTVDELERIMNINVMAHYWTLQAFLPTMVKNNKGHIVALSSGCGLGVLRNLVPYCASKFAVRGMMEALYEDLYTDPNCKIKFTTIYPSMVDTGLCKKPHIRFQNMTPMLQPKDVAQYIMSAQRREMRDASYPRYLYSFVCVVRLFPEKVQKLIQDFLDVYIASDL